MGSYLDSKDAKVAFAFVFSLLAMMDLIGNTMVILIIIKNKNERTPMNYLLVNLAIADMMVGLFIAPRFIFMPFFTHPEGMTGTVICKLITGGNLAWTGGACSVFTLVAVAFERCYAAVNPYSSKAKMTIKKLKYTAFGCWFGAVLLNLPLYLTIYYDEKNNFCFEYWPERMPWLPVAYAYTWLIAAGVFPVFTMTVLYSTIIYNLWFKRSGNSNASQLAIIKHRKRATKVMIIVSVIYAICWLPDTINYILVYSTHTSASYGDIFFISCIILTTFNSAINPVVYTFQNKRFRKHLKGLLFCTQGKNRVEQVPSNSTISTRKRFNADISAVAKEQASTNGKNIEISTKRHR